MAEHSPADTLLSSVFRLPPLVQERGLAHLPLDPWYVHRTPASGPYGWLDDLEDATDAAIDDLLMRRLREE